MVEISALLLGLGLFTGGITRFSQKEVAGALVEGCSDFAYVAVITGLVRGALVTLEGGVTVDTILNSLASSLGGLSKFLFAMILLISQVIVSFFVPSSSGVAALTMSTMALLGDLMNIGRDIVALSN